MKFLELLKGKKVMVDIGHGVEYEMEIKEVKENKHSVEVGPSNASNDWWPETREWNTFTVYFTNGYQKTYDSLDSV